MKTITTEGCKRASCFEWSLFYVVSVREEYFGKKSNVARPFTSATPFFIKLSIRLVYVLAQLIAVVFTAAENINGIGSSRVNHRLHEDVGAVKTTFTKIQFLSK